MIQEEILTTLLYQSAADGDIRALRTLLTDEDFQKRVKEVYRDLGLTKHAYRSVVMGETQALESLISNARFRQKLAEISQEMRLTELARRAAVNGDIESLKALLIDVYFQERLKKICLWLYSSRDSNWGYFDWEDVFQDVLQKLWTKIDQYNCNGSIVAYVWTIVRYTLSNYIRKEGRRYDKNFLPMLQGDAPPDNLYYQVARQKALGKLDKELRDVVDLWREGETLENIGQKLGVSTSTAHRRLVKALKQLIEQRNKR